jgi:chemotaxis protein methyltransferase CheR
VTPVVSRTIPAVRPTAPSVRPPEAPSARPASPSRPRPAKAVHSTQVSAPPATDPGETIAAGLAHAGQRALDDGDHAAAIIAFRKCAYLTPDDPVAHLHLGLALEAAGDRPAAQRAFGAARRSLLSRHPDRPDLAIGGYAAAELIRLLDAKQENR